MTTEKIEVDGAIYNIQWTEAQAKWSMEEKKDFIRAQAQREKEKYEKQAEQLEQPRAKQLKVIDQDFGFIEPTDRIIIIGAANSGKTVTMHYIAEGLIAKGTKVNMLAPLRVLKYKEQGKIKAPYKFINYKWPRLESNTMTLFDDAQLRISARKAYENISFLEILSMARHRKAGIIITTQRTSQIDKQTIDASTYFIVKKPGIFSIAERPALRKLCEIWRNNFLKLEKEYDVNPQQYSWVISDMKEGWVGPTGTPTYWTTELGDW